jgi:hypothetical protein
MLEREMASSWRMLGWQLPGGHLALEDAPAQPPTPRNEAPMPALARAARCRAAVFALFLVVVPALMLLAALLLVQWAGGGFPGAPQPPGGARLARPPR